MLRAPFMRWTLAAVALAAVVASGCGETRALRKKGPLSAYLMLEVPRREAPGVGERWAMVRDEGTAFLLHEATVERRRTRQTCGSVPPAAFLDGWDALKAAGLLRAGEDFRLIAPPGAEPFAGRLQLQYVGQSHEVTARRPLSRAEAQKLAGVLRGWEARLEAVRLEDLPTELRVEVGMEMCTPPARLRQGTRAQPAP